MNDMQRMLRDVMQTRNELTLAISGTASRQTAFRGSEMRPFHALVVTDLNATTVTATVVLSRPANGTVTDLAGGSYNKATGVSVDRTAQHFRRLRKAGAAVDAAMQPLRLLRR